jgi:hypothetical protein
VALVSRKALVVWGGWDGLGDVATGGQYDPTTDLWTPTSVAGAPSPRDSQTAVWTGTRMVVWGGSGYDGTNIFPLDTGGWYDPATDIWTPTTPTSAPSARYFHTAVWTGREMVVWGGEEDGSAYLDTGGSYDLGTSLDNDGDGLRVCDGDCDDANAAVRPGAIEVCNGLDDDCDTVTDNGGDALCDDAIFCTDDTCDGLAGCGHVTAPCGDANACTADTCTVSSGCVHPSANVDATGFSTARVDGRDLVVLADAWNSCPADPVPSRYNDAADLDPTDPCIEAADFHNFMTAFGRNCP